MKEKIVLATRNKGKLEEFQSLLQGLPVEVLSLNAFPEISDIPETGRTFAENALIKAKTTARCTGLAAVADDSGLEVDYLDGAPGVYSARFAGEDKDDSANLQKLLQLLEGLPEDRRTARFRCALAVVTAAGEERLVEEKCEGMITYEPRGSGGFGYDPVFLVPRFALTMAELTMEQKNAISHRGKAFIKAVPLIKSLLHFK